MDQPPDFLYRFRRAGSSLAYMLNEIRGVLFCATSSQLNDPFDGLGLVPQEQAKVTLNFLLGPSSFSMGVTVVPPVSRQVPGECSFRQVSDSGVCRSRSCPCVDYEIGSSSRSDRSLAHAAYCGHPQATNASHFSPSDLSPGDDRHLQSRLNRSDNRSQLGGSFLARSVNELVKGMRSEDGSDESGRLVFASLQNSSLVGRHFATQIAVTLL